MRFKLSEPCGKSNPLLPDLRSPCCKCKRVKESKFNNQACQSCKPREDLALAYGGDVNALKRYIKFDYKNIGEDQPEKIIKQPVKKQVPARKKGKGRQPASEAHYEGYFDTLGQKVNKRYKTDFKTMKEVMAFLYEKYQDQKYIAENELNISAFVVYSMLKIYNIPRLTKREVTLKAQKNISSHPNYL
jgi:hypothetical protein